MTTSDNRRSDRVALSVVGTFGIFLLTAAVSAGITLGRLEGFASNQARHDEQIQKLTEGLDTLNIEMAEQNQISKEILSELRSRHGHT